MAMRPLVALVAVSIGVVIGRTVGPYPILTVTIPETERSAPFTAAEVATAKVAAAKATAVAAEATASSTVSTTAATTSTTTRECGG